MMLVKIHEELRSLLPPTLFFFVTLHVVALVKSLMLKGMGISGGTSMSLLVASIILGKAVLIADLMPFINLYPNKPLIYNVIWKTLIYFLLSITIHYTELFLEEWWKTGSAQISYQHISADIVWPRFWAVQIVLAVMIFTYCAMHELIKVIGPDKMKHIFFGNSWH